MLFLVIIFSIVDIREQFYYFIYLLFDYLIIIQKRRHKQTLLD